MPRCKGCGAEIIFLGSQNGKPIPCNYKPVLYKEKAGAKEKIVTRNGMVVSCVLNVDLGSATGIGYIPHWATCPKADQFRKKANTC